MARWLGETTRPRPAVVSVYLCCTVHVRRIYLGARDLTRPEVARGRVCVRLPLAPGRSSLASVHLSSVCVRVCTSLPRQCPLLTSSRGAGLALRRQKKRQEAMGGCDS